MRRLLHRQLHPRYRLDTEKQRALLDQAIDKLKLPSTHNLAKHNRCENPHHYYLMVRALQSILLHPANSKDTDENVSQRKNELLEFLESEIGNEVCDKNISLELLRRDCQTNVYTSANDRLKLLARMQANLENGDTDWATIKLAVESAYAVALHPEGTACIHEESLFGIPEEEKLATWWGEVEDTDEPSEFGTAITQSVHVLWRLRMLLDKLSGGGEEPGPSKLNRGFTLGLLELATSIEGREYAAPICGELFGNPFA